MDAALPLNYFGERKQEGGVYQFSERYYRARQYKRVSQYAGASWRQLITTTNWHWLHGRKLFFICASCYVATMKMQKLQQVSTANVAPSDGLMHWRNAMCQVGVGGQLRPIGDSSFRAALAQYSLGDTVISYWNSDAVENDRTLSDCEQHPSENICLSLIRKGRAIVEQGGRKLELKPGDCFLLNSNMPSYFKADAYESMTLTLSKSAILWMPNFENYMALPLAKISDWGKVLSAMLSAMTEENITRLPMNPGILIEQVCSLLSLTLAGDDTNVPSTYKQGLLRRLRQDLQVHYHDYSLTPTDIADKNKISVRTLHAAFSDAGTTFGRELLSIRMGKAGQALSDQRLGKKTVAEIAALVGYKAPSHFITQFKRSYGVTPADYRRRYTNVSETD